MAFLLPAHLEGRKVNAQPLERFREAGKGPVLVPAEREPKTDILMSYRV